jgi:choline dehydrogenase-like flavoprotein
VTTHYDVIILGSGAGGGTLAHHLAPTAKKMLLLERGDWMTREPENWNAEEVVVVNHIGQTETCQGGIVVVSCGAANSAKLLLLSANDKHPNGLANGSDQVGRN